MGALDFLKAPSASGTGSRVRARRATEAARVVWTTRAIAAVLQLSKGRLDDSLLKSTTCGLHPAGIEEANPVGLDIHRRMCEAWARRPDSMLCGAAALRRQRGAEPVAPAKMKSGESQAALPKRGQIWPAKVSIIALLDFGVERASIVDFSPRCADYLMNYVDSMLQGEQTRQEPEAKMASGEENHTSTRSSWIT